MLSALGWLLPRAFIPQAEQHMLWKIEALSLLQQYSYSVLAMALHFPLSCKGVRNCRNPFLCLLCHGREHSRISWAPLLLIEIGCLIDFVMQHPWQRNWILIWYLIMQFFLYFTRINVRMNCFNARVNANMQVSTAAWNTGGERNLDWSRKEQSVSPWGTPSFL